VWNTNIAVVLIFAQINRRINACFPSFVAGIRTLFDSYHIDRQQKTIVHQQSLLIEARWLSNTFQNNVVLTFEEFVVD
jgi:hypothetical protein